MDKKQRKGSCETTGAPARYEESIVDTTQCVCLLLGKLYLHQISRL